MRKAELCRALLSSFRHHACMCTGDVERVHRSSQLTQGQKPIFCFFIRSKSENCEEWQIKFSKTSSCDSNQFLARMNLQKRVFFAAVVVSQPLNYSGWKSSKIVSFKFCKGTLEAAWSNTCFLILILTPKFW